MANRQIQSPGVQISEIDLSLSPNLGSTTTIFIPGFAQKGPTDIAVKVASISEFEQIFGAPSNGAERYFYYSVNAALQSPADVLVCRLPYGDYYANDYYSLIAFPALYLSAGLTTSTGTLCSDGGIGAAQAQRFDQTTGTYMLGRPSYYVVTKADYNSWKAGSLFNYGLSCNSLNPSVLSLSSAALIIGNQSQSIINSNFEGLYVGLMDNCLSNPDADKKTVRAIQSINSTNTLNTYPNSASSTTSYFGQNNYTTLNTSRLGLPLTGTSQQTGCVSRIQEDAASTFDSNVRAYDDSISIGVFRLKQSVFSDSSIALDVSLVENYQGSLDSHRTANTSQGGPAQSFFIDTIASQSSNITVKTNPYLSRLIQGIGYQGANGTPTVKIRVANPGLYDSSTLSINDSGSPVANANNRTALIGVSGYATLINAVTSVGVVDSIFPIGLFNSTNLAVKNIGDVPGKLQKVFSNFTNSDIYPFNLAIEAGLGTIFAGACAAGGIYDDFTYIDIGSAAAVDGTTTATGLYNQTNFSYSDAKSSAASNYCAVLDTFINFVQDASRKDFLVIADPLTNIFVQGNSIKNADKPGATISKDIYWPLNNLYSKYNNSYLATYATCVKVHDATSGLQPWVPFSGFAANIMATIDSNYYPWYAPAGFTRGVVSGVLDLAIYPKQKDRDTLYKGSFNPVAFFPSEGFVVYGQKTMLSVPSAFDRINVRRLFLSLETSTKNTLKYFVFEPNTLLTRTRVINTLTPIFENAKNTQGVYDYLIICDERNNTPAIIDDNTLVVDIYIKPVRTAEFILCNFYATTTNVNFQEIVG